MSSSEPTDTAQAWPRPHGTLIVEAPPGVDIHVADGGYTPVMRGADRVQQDLPPGVYIVRWNAAGRVESRTVMLGPGRVETVTGGRFSLGSAPPSASPDAGPHSHAQYQAARRASAAEDGPQSDSEVVVFIRAADRRTRSDPARSIRLTNLSDTAMRSGDLEGLPLRLERDGEDVEEGWAARRYRVSPGLFRLIYTTSEQRVAAQTVYAMPGRRTVVFLKYGATTVCKGEGETLSLTRHRGVDPTETTMVSRPLDQAIDWEDDELRLADILLHILTGGRGPLSRKLVDDLCAPQTDPYLKLYGAAALTHRLGSGRTAQTSGQPNSWEIEALEDGRGAAPWQGEAAERLLDSMPGGFPWPDVACLRWRLQALGRANPNMAEPDRLAAPPMLACAWSWASSHSTTRPEVTPLTGALAEAASGRLDAEPWLVWRTTPPRQARRAASAPIATSEQLEGQVSAFFAEVQKLAPARAEAPSAFGARLDPEIAQALSPQAQATVQTALAMSAGALPHETVTPSALLAGALGLPAQALSSQIEDTLAELSQAVGAKDGMAEL